MPRRSPPPNRLLVEDALLPEELIALRSSAAVMDVPLDRWPRVTVLAVLWGTVATVRIAKRLRGQYEGLSEDRSLALAAGELGLNGETIRTRLRSFFQDAYGGQKARCLSPSRDVDAKGIIRDHEISGGEDG